MTVTVDVSRYLKKYFDRVGLVEIEIDENSTIADLVVIIKKECGVHIPAATDTDEELRRYFIVSQDRNFAKMTDHITGGSIRLIPPISGG